MENESTLRMTPIDLNEKGEPKEPKLEAALQRYCEKEFGSLINISYYMRVWAIMVVRPSDPEYFEVIGVTSMRNQADCPLFHITPPTIDKAGFKVAEQARDMAVYRMYAYLEDVGMRGTSILIYVSEGAQRLWRRFLGKIKAKPANRFELPIHRGE